MVRPFPISVDFEQICRDASSLPVAEEMERLSDELELGDVVVGLGIDRIDYTKGIPHRFRAMGRFLEKYPEYIGKVVFVQAGVMSRTDVDAYQQLAEQIEQLLAEINGRFGRRGWQPIIYMPTDLPNVSLLALRRLARFCVVSSLHDGMNLVAKEYVASRSDEDGVLILSPFTGAAHELTDALIVNPYATEHFADAFRDASGDASRRKADSHGPNAGDRPGEQHLQVGGPAAGGLDAGHPAGPAPYPGLLNWPIHP